MNRLAVPNGCRKRTRLHDRVRSLAREIGLVPLTTSLESTPSNDLTEALANLSISTTHGPAHVSMRLYLSQSDGWFEHYNTVDPREALGSRLARAFRKQIVESATVNARGVRRLLLW